MRKVVLTLALLTLFFTGVPVCGLAVSLKVPNLTVGSAGGTVTIPVLMSTVDLVPTVQFTIDYDNAVATYQSVALGSACDPSAFITLVNPNPPAGTVSPGTNASVIITVAGGGPAGRISGSNLEIARVTFALAAAVCDASPLTFDANCAYTQVDVAGVMQCYPQVVLTSGQLAATCATDAAPPASGLLQLLQNQPNPFNPSTNIRFFTPNIGQVQLTIVDVLGHRVRQLVNEVMPGAWHTMTWNGCDDSGMKVACGVYYYRLASGDQVQVRQMLLLK